MAVGTWALRIEFVRIVGIRSGGAGVTARNHGTSYGGLRFLKCKAGPDDIGQAD